MMAKGRAKSAAGGVEAGPASSVSNREGRR